MGGNEIGSDPVSGARCSSISYGGESAQARHVHPGERPNVTLLRGRSQGDLVRSRCRDGWGRCFRATPPMPRGSGRRRTDHGCRSDRRCDSGASASRRAWSPARLPYSKEKKGHGTGNLVEGPLDPRSTVAIVDDVATTGGSSIQAIDAVEAMHCKVALVIVMLDRLEGAADAFASRGVAFRPLLTIRDLGVEPLPAGLLVGRKWEVFQPDSEIFGRQVMETSLHRTLKERYALGERTARDRRRAISGRRR